MSQGRDSGLRCGTDSVQIARVERLLEETSSEDLLRIFSDRELGEAGEGKPRTSALAARFAAKEACLKLFPRETALGEISAADFTICRNGYGDPYVELSLRAQQILDHYRLAPVAVSLTHDPSRASAVAMTQPMPTRVPAIGKIAYRFLPVRKRTVLANLSRVFGGRIDDDEIRRLAQAFYGHLARSVFEFAQFALLTQRSRESRVRVENKQAALRAAEGGKGLLMLTGHLGNWEFALPAAVATFPELRGRFHVLRKTTGLRLLDTFVSRRFRRAGVSVIPTRGSLDAVLDRLAAGDAVIFVLDQHAGGRDGVLVDFFGHPAWTFRSLAVIALSTGAPVVPVSCYRESDGAHIVRVEDALETIHCDDVDTAIRLNSQMYNAALERMVLRHPEQWLWLHRRWKDERGRAA
jgi:KDO2-lipid IV(A) lauroyltransferase